jgi:hypothetical protein
VGSYGAPLLAADDANLYWADTATHRISVDGGTPVDLSIYPAVAIASRAGYVFWIAGGNLYRAPVGGFTDGGAPTTLAPAVNATSLVVDDNFVYVGFTVGTYGEINQYDRVTGGRTTPYTNLLPIAAMAMDDTRLYWVTNTANGKVLSLPKIPDGSPPLVLAAGQDRPASIAQSPDAVFWSDAQGTVYRVTKP